MRFDIITIFPELLSSVFSAGVIKKAIEKGLLEVRVHNLRDFAHNKHRQVDDRPYGGGEGMVIKPDPIFEAVEKIKVFPETAVYLLSPQGKKFDSLIARELAKKPQIILICGRYEGVDERVAQHLVDGELSIGDYVLTGGEPAAWVIVEAVARFIPGVVGKPQSVVHDSFFDGLLDYPHYTRPREFRGMKVPSILFSGDHEKILKWRKRKALEKTWRLRPDILKKKQLSLEEKRLLDDIIKEGIKNEPD
ncbi:MAG: tRNA (guanosine(37)-N1)-methyltransferase TrmD [Candidatus Aminicenantes bacterium]|nr:tRNA (guanosine(37)-N1)-methyltransferase TrmD [Candidatus Aminicenantes bacterium]